MTIQVFQPSLGREEMEAVCQVFYSNWVGKGPITDQFEAAFAQHINADRTHVCSVSCATEGLFQAMELLEVGEGDEVILPSISFVGAANAIAATGARPVFCDVNSRTFNPHVDHIGRVRTPKTRAIILLHYGGVPCDMVPILDFSQAYGITIVEDSACSPASTYFGQACGTIGDIGIWSMDAMKIVVAADGGMMHFDTATMAERAERQMFLGLNNASGMAAAAAGAHAWWQFDVTCFGRRAVMNDVQSAIGLEQLKKLPAFVERRRAIHEYYDQKFDDVGWITCPPPIPEGCASSYYFYWIQVSAAVRDDLAHYLKERDIFSTFRYYPLHRIPIYCSRERCTMADLAADMTLLLPLHNGLSDAEVETVIETVRQFGVDHNLTTIH